MKEILLLCIENIYYKKKFSTKILWEMLMTTALLLIMSDEFVDTFEILQSPFEVILLLGEILIKKHNSII